MKRKPNSKVLISIAMYQLMMRHSYDEICVKDICTKANVSRMSFYRYFNNKEDIFLSFCDERFAEFYESFMKYNDPTFEIFIKCIMTYFKKYSREIQILQKAGKINMLMEQFESYTSYILNRTKTENLKKYRDNPLTVSFFSGALFNVLVKWSSHNFKENEDVMTASLLELIRI